MIIHDSTVPCECDYREAVSMTTSDEISVLYKRALRQLIHPLGRMVKETML